jgi:uncharacterized protein YxeA
MITFLIITICLAIVAYGLNEYFKYINPYVDEMIKEQEYVHTTTTRDGCKTSNDYTVRQYKRTYKNGKVTFYEKTGK